MAIPAPPPRIITARSIGLAFANVWGQLGPEQFVTGHYSAGGRARDWREAIAKARSFHADHKRKGWGGIGYHYVIADDGALICARPTLLKGTHVGAANTNNIGVNCPGTTGDRPTPQQKSTYRWLLTNAHTPAMPKAHRTDRDLRIAVLRGHNQWPGHRSNGCPGRFLAMYVAGVRPLDADEEEEQEETGEAGGGDYPDETTHGTTVADGRHVSPEEAEEGRNLDEVEEELPEEDPEFDEDLRDE
jgi:N-acetylmuramoyl-L-alanine amidase